MTNLVWIEDGEILIDMVDEQIHPESEIEKLLYNTKGILQDTILISKRIKSNTRDEIPDLIGMDKENNIIIIELKDEPATSAIIPQVLKYAFWVENNPDSIKALWLEKEDRPEDFMPEWDKLNIKIRIIAPEFRPEVIRLIYKINYVVELTELKRFNYENDSFVLFDTLEIPDDERKKTATGTDTYDKAYYEKEGYDPFAIETFFKKIEEVENLIKKKEWNLNLNYNKGYVSFKHGFPNLFGIYFMNLKTICIFFKIRKKQAEDIEINKNIKMYSYVDYWKEARYRIDSADFDINDLMPLFEAAYKNIVGRRR
jgi:hypothetical protein